MYKRRGGQGLFSDEESTVSDSALGVATRRKDLLLDPRSPAKAPNETLCNGNHTQYDRSSFRPAFEARRRETHGIADPYAVGLSLHTPWEALCSSLQLRTCYLPCSLVCIGMGQVTLWLSYRTGPRNRGLQKSKSSPTRHEGSSFRHESVRPRARCLRGWGTLGISPTSLPSSGRRGCFHCGCRGSPLRGVVKQTCRP